MISASSWMSSVSCSSTSVVAEDASGVTLVLQWLSFMLLSPCPQRLLLSFIDVVFLLILFVFAIQKPFSRFTSRNTSTVNEPLITKAKTVVNSSLWFKFSLLVSALVAVLSVVLSSLAFTRNTQTPWKLIDGICWLIQAFSFLVVTVLIVHEKRFHAATHALSLRVFLVVNFIVVALFASSGVVRLVSGTGNTGLLKSEDIGSLLSLPFSLYLLIVSIKGSTGIILATEAESLNGHSNGNGKVAEADELNKSSNVSGWASASIPSKVFWLWMNPLLDKGYQSPLKLEDIPTLSPEHRAEKMSKLFEEKWPKPHENSKHPVRTTLLRCFWKHVAFTACLAILRLCVMYVGPLLIQRFVDFTSEAWNVDSVHTDYKFI